MTDESNRPTPSRGFTAQSQLIAEHWAKLAVTFEGAVEVLRSKGINPGDATVEDLHSLDMMHMGGLAATDSLSEMAGITEGTRVLDVGSGVGGPARRMASKFGGKVWGVELTAQLYRTAERLTKLVGMQSQVHFDLGSALSLPFDDEAFDVVVMQHVAMQIDEKDQLFGELARVLDQNGCLAMHEIFGGNGGPPFYPLPWATESGMSSLESLEACSDRLIQLGFYVGNFEDLSEEGRNYHEGNVSTFRAALEEQRGEAGLSVEVLKDRLGQAQAMERNLREDRIKVGMLVCRKQDRPVA